MPNRKLEQRRWLLRLALAGGVAGLVGTGKFVGGASTEPLLLNRVNSGIRPTVLRAEFGGPAMVVVNRRFPGAAIAARLGPAGTGERADEAAVSGINTAAATGNYAPVGVMGGAKGAGSRGVFGYSDDGVAVAAVITGQDGVAVEANGPTGVRSFGRDVGLEVQGPVLFSQAGVVEVPSGATSVIVSPTGEPLPRQLNKNSFILATVVGSGSSTWVASTKRLSAHSFRIALNRPAPAKGATVGFIIIN